MFVCNVNHCDFCVCAFSSETLEPPSHMHTERIFREDELWKEYLFKAKNIFYSSLLPELLGKWYTRAVVTSNTDHCDENAASDSNDNTAIANQTTINSTSGSQEELYYYCRGPEHGFMIACDNTGCKLNGFTRIALAFHRYQQGIGIVLIVLSCHNF